MVPRFLLNKPLHFGAGEEINIQRMKRIFLFLHTLLCCFLSFTSCLEKPVDISGISVKSVGVEVEYTKAKVYGDIQVLPTAPEISGIIISYGISKDDLSKTINASYDMTNGYSAHINDLEDGKEYYFRVDIIIGNVKVSSSINSFITFPIGPIDLDLPSGNKWASHNIGAGKPTEAGSYFAWGETKEKTNYSWETYTHCIDGDRKRLSKYTTEDFYANFGILDNLVELESEDDAAYTILGSEWETPSYRDWQELGTNCVITTVQINGIIGLRVSSKEDRNNNKKFIFLPAQCGVYNGTSISHSKNDAYYWTSTLDAEQSYRALCINLTTSGKLMINDGDRALGETIRPITK